MSVAESDSSPKKPTEKLNRRDFLKLAGGVGLGFVANSLLGKETTGNKGATQRIVEDKDGGSRNASPVMKKEVDLPPLEEVDLPPLERIINAQASAIALMYDSRLACELYRAQIKGEGFPLIKSYVKLTRVTHSMGEKIIFSGKAYNKGGLEFTLTFDARLMHVNYKGNRVEWDDKPEINKAVEQRLSVIADDGTQQTFEIRLDQNLNRRPSYPYHERRKPSWLIYVTFQANQLDLAKEVAAKIKSIGEIYNFIAQGIKGEHDFIEISGSFIPPTRDAVPLIKTDAQGNFNLYWLIYDEGEFKMVNHKEST